MPNLCLCANVCNVFEHCPFASCRQEKQASEKPALYIGNIWCHTQTQHYTYYAQHQYNILSFYAYIYNNMMGLHSQFAAAGLQFWLWLFGRILHSFPFPHVRVERMNVSRKCIYMRSTIGLWLKTFVDFIATRTNFYGIWVSHWFQLKYILIFVSNYSLLLKAYILLESSWPTSKSCVDQQQTISPRHSRLENIFWAMATIFFFYYCLHCQGPLKEKQ